MQRRGGLIAFIILNIVISLAVAFGVIQFLSNQTPAAPPVQLITVEIRITNTPDPNATIPVRIITATPPPGGFPTALSSAEVAVLPTGLLPGTDGAAAPAVNVTLDSTTIGVIGSSEALAQTATALPPNCIIHVVKEGDTPFAIAETYAADPFQMLAVNGLDEVAATLLQIGDTLIVPLPGCPLAAAEAQALLLGATAEPSATPTDAITLTPTAGPTLTPSPTIRPTVTLAPTAANAVIQIVDVRGVGDITAESVTVRNTGQVVSLAGWTLSDADGNTYTFAEQRLFQNAQITLNTRIGTVTPIALFWGRDQAVFQSGDTITLRDAAGGVQASFRVP